MRPRDRASGRKSSLSLSSTRFHRRQLRRGRTFVFGTVSRIRTHADSKQIASYEYLFFVIKLIASR